MVTTLTEFITVSRYNGRVNDNILAVALNTYNFNLTELRVKSNAVHKENISKKPLDSAGSTRPNWSGKQTYTHMIRMNNAAG